MADEWAIICHSVPSIEHVKEFPTLSFGTNLPHFTTAYPTQRLYHGVPLFIMAKHTSWHASVYYAHPNYQSLRYSATLP